VVRLLVAWWGPAWLVLEVMREMLFEEGWDEGIGPMTAALWPLVVAVAALRSGLIGAAGGATLGLLTYGVRRGLSRIASP
jgi:hypothetical protein